MKNTRRFIFALLILLLIGCSPEKDAATQPSPAGPVGVSASAPAVSNLALNGDVTASAHRQDEPPQNAADGNPETVWNAGSSVPQWIQLDLGTAAVVTRIRLIVAQYPNGETLHRVLAGDSVEQLRLVHEFGGATFDGQALEFVPGEPLTGIRVIRIVTTQSPSWVAWREIEVSGYEGGETSTPRPVINAADVIYFNGTILTMERDRPTAEAIAIKGDEILAVGNEADVMDFKGDGTKLIDLQGLTLTPGFIDSHAHRIGDRWHFGNVSAEEMMAKALSQGWTSIHELFVFDQRLNELVNLDRANALPLRVSMYLTMNFEYTYDKWWQGYQPLQQYSPYLQIAGLKITLDREWGEQVFFSQEQYTQMVLDGTQAGWQVATHSFSPKANQIVLNGIRSRPERTRQRHLASPPGAYRDNDG